MLLDDEEVDADDDGVEDGGVGGCWPALEA